MRGNIKIINSATDAEEVGLTREQIINIATQKVTYDDAVYPESYDRSLKQGDDGYISPILREETEVDDEILRRFNIN